MCSRVLNVDLLEEEGAGCRFDRINGSTVDYVNATLELCIVKYKFKFLGGSCVAGEYLGSAELDVVRIGCGISVCKGELSYFSITLVVSYCGAECTIEMIRNNDLYAIFGAVKGGAVDCLTAVNFLYNIVVGACCCEAELIECEALVCRVGCGLVGLCTCSNVPCGVGLKELEVECSCAEVLICNSSAYIGGVRLGTFDDCFDSSGNIMVGELDSLSAAY